MEHTIGQNRHGGSTAAEQLSEKLETIQKSASVVAGGDRGAMELGLIVQVGGLDRALACLRGMIREQNAGEEHEPQESSLCGTECGGEPV